MHPNSQKCSNNRNTHLLTLEIYLEDRTLACKDSNNNQSLNKDKLTEASTMSLKVILEICHIKKKTSIKVFLIMKTAALILRKKKTGPNNLLMGIISSVVKMQKIMAQIMYHQISHNRIARVNLHLIYGMMILPHQHNHHIHKILHNQLLYTQAYLI